MTGSSDRGLRVWDLATGKCLKAYDCVHRGIVTVVVVDWTKALSLSGAVDNTLQLWDLNRHSCSRTLSGHTRAVNALSVDWAAMQALSASLDDTLRLWDLTEGGAALQVIRAESEFGLISLAVDWQAGRAIAGAGDRAVRVYDLGSGHVKFTFHGHVGVVTSVALS